MPKKSEKKTEPLRTRFDYDTNPNVPQKNPQAVMIKQIPPMNYDDVGPKLVDMPPPKMDYDNPLPIPAPIPLPPPPPPAMPPVMDKGPMNLPPPENLPPPPTPLMPGVMSCPECGEGAEIEEDAADVLECPKCGFEIYSCMMGKTALAPQVEQRWQDFLKQHGGERKPEMEVPPAKREDPTVKRPFPASNMFWAMNTPSDRHEKSRLFENVLRDLGRKNDAYNEALNFFIEYKAKDKFPTQQEADAAARKLIQLSVKPNPNLVKMQDFVKILLSKEPASKMKALAEELNPGGAAKRQKLSEAIQEAAERLKKESVMKGLKFDSGTPVDIYKLKNQKRILKPVDRHTYLLDGEKVDSDDVQWTCPKCKSKYNEAAYPCKCGQESPYEIKRS